MGRKYPGGMEFALFGKFHSTGENKKHPRKS
jgi:hypothetical protein